MPTDITQIDVNEDTFQNPQELVSIWGTIREEIVGPGGEILQTYAVFGGYDFHLAFEVESGEVCVPSLPGHRAVRSRYRNNADTPV